MVVGLETPDGRPVGEVELLRGLLVLLARRVVFGVGDGESVGSGTSRLYWTLEKGTR